MALLWKSKPDVVNGIGSSDPGVLINKSTCEKIKRRGWLLLCWRNAPIRASPEKENTMWGRAQWQSDEVCAALSKCTLQCSAHFFLSFSHAFKAHDTWRGKVPSSICKNSTKVVSVLPDISSVLTTSCINRIIFAIWRDTHLLWGSRKANQLVHWWYCKREGTPHHAHTHFKHTDAQREIQTRAWCWRRCCPENLFCQQCRAQLQWGTRALWMISVYVGLYPARYLRGPVVPAVRHLCLIRQVWRRRAPFELSTPHKKANWYSKKDWKRNDENPPARKAF